MAGFNEANLNSFKKHINEYGELSGKKNPSFETLKDTLNNYSSYSKQNKQTAISKYLDNNKGDIVLNNIVTIFNHIKDVMKNNEDNIKLIEVKDGTREYVKNEFKSGKWDACIWTYVVKIDGIDSLGLVGMTCNKNGDEFGNIKNLKMTINSNVVESIVKGLDESKNNNQQSILIAFVGD